MAMMTKTRLFWFALVVALAALVAFQWGLFAPKDYEECAESAARTAKSKEALAILISSCQSKFMGRRKLGVGYTYYDARQDRDFDIAGPNPDARELQFIEKQYSIYLKEKEQAAIAQADVDRRTQEADAERERELESRRQAALKLIQILSSNIECKLYTQCGLYRFTVNVKNSSKEDIAALSFGWAFISTEAPNCPTTLQNKRREQVNLRPGDTTVLNIDATDGPPTKQFRYCVMVTDLTIRRPGTHN